MLLFEFDATPIIHTESSPSIPDNSSLSDPYYPNAHLEHVYFVVHLLIFLLSFVGNSLALLALLTTRSNIYPWFFNLVTADLLKTAICMPYSLYIFSQKLLRSANSPEPPFCEYEGVIFMICLLVSLLSNAGISIDRVVAIIAPFYYARHLMKLNPLLVICPTWISVVMAAFVPFYYRGYTYANFIPTCYLELHNILMTRTDGFTLKVVTGLINAVLLGLPIFIVCLSCAIVTLKMYKAARIREKHDNSNGVSVSRVCQAGHSDSLASRRMAKLSLVSLDGATQTSQIDLATAPDIQRVELDDDLPLRDSFSSEDCCDKMIMLHKTAPSSKSTQKSSSAKRRYEMQKRAVVTMSMVAVTFFACHIILFIYWAFWDVFYKTGDCGLLDRGPPVGHFNYGFCVTLHTVQITLVYLNSPLNVLIYYYRCSYLRRRIVEFAKSVKTFILRR